MKARPEIYRTESLCEHASPKRQRFSMPFTTQSATCWDCVVNLGNSGMGAKGGGQR